MKNRDKSQLKKWAKENMKGVENCTFPSFTPNLKELDEEGIRLDVRQAIKHGFFSTLCTCEVGLSFEEAKRFVGIVADEAQDKILVSTTILFDSLEDNMSMLEHADKVGADAALLGYPANFYPKSEEDIFSVTKEMCDSTNLAIVVYPSPHFNFERFHPSGFNPKLLNRMADFENVVAMKIGEPGLFADCQRMFGDHVLINAPVERMLPLMQTGFKQQWIGAGPYECFQSPEKPYFVQYFNHLRNGETDQAMEIYWRMTLLRVTFEQAFSPTTMLGTYHNNLHKYYQWCVGGNGGFTRQPSMKMHQHEMDRHKMALRMSGIIPREPDEEFYVGRVNFSRN